MPRFSNPMFRLLLAVGLLAGVLGWVVVLLVSMDYPDLVQSRAWLPDREARQGIATVARQPFKPFSGPLYAGNDQRPIWLRLTLAPAPSHAAQQRDWLLVFQPNYTQHIEVWLPGPAGTMRHVLVGADQAFRQRDVPILMPAVRVQPLPDRPLTLYARIATPTAPVYARVMSAQDADLMDSRLHFVAGICLGVGIIAALISAMVALILRDALWGLDALYGASGGLLLSLQLGLVSQYLVPDRAGVASQLTLLANIWTMIIITLFSRRLYTFFAVPRWGLRSYWPILLGGGLALLCLAFGHGDLAMRINNICALMLTLLGFVLIAVARHEDLVLILGLRLLNAFLFCYMLWWSIPLVFHLQSAMVWSLYPNLPHGVTMIVMMSFLLVRRTQLSILEARQLALEKHHAEQRLQLEQTRHEETSSFLGMVLHEVKSPLNYIRMATSNLERDLAGQDAAVLRRLHNIQVSVDSVDDVLERSVEVDSLEQSGLPLRLAEINVVALVVAQCTAHPAAERLQPHLPEALAVTTDPEVLALILRNLLDNAVKYSPPQSDIMLKLWRDAAQWWLQVRNTVGQAGFPDSQRIFHKYYRAPLASHQAGMGLGLYWVAGSATRMGGEIRYTRDKDEVVFTLCLPT